MRTTPEQRLNLRAAHELDDSEMGEQIVALLDDHDEQAFRIAAAIKASDNGGGSATDAIQDMLVVLDTAERLPTYCAYCGHRVAGDDEAASQISEHIATCERHPMRAVEKDRDEAIKVACESTLLLEKENGGNTNENPRSLRDICEEIFGAAHALRIYPLE